MADEIGARIKQIRKALNLTMEEFGDEIGIKKSTISLIENDKSGLSSSVRLAILREFNVNPTWLDRGEGEMFLKMDANKELAIYMAQILKLPESNIKRRIVKALWNLPQEDLEKAVDYLIEIAEELKKPQLSGSDSTK